MPEIQSVYAAKNGQPAGHIKHPTTDETYAEALLTELGGYHALLDEGRTERGGESIADIIDRIEAELQRIGWSVPTTVDVEPVPAAYAGDEDSPRFEPVDDDVPPPATLAEVAVNAAEAHALLVDDDVPPPVRRKR